MANRQVRLDPDVCRWVEDCAEDWSIDGTYCSLSAATNRLLRTLRDEPVPEPMTPPMIPADSPAAAEGFVTRPVYTRTRTTVNPRLQSILRQNGQQ